MFIEEYIKSCGFYYEPYLIRNLYLSLKTKPFVILAGISGTGKSKLARLFSEAIGATNDNGRFLLIPVRPDWSDSTDLLGYKDIQGNFNPGILTRFVYSALKDRDKPYFICLDEMNLARVEYYLSEILSIIETRRWRGDRIITGGLLRDELFSGEERVDTYRSLYLPDNLYIIGTVNMDETTFPFSKKVLDRVNTIEFSEVNLEPVFEEFETGVSPLNVDNDFLRSEYITLKDCRHDIESDSEIRQIFEKTISILNEINEVLYETNLHFGYRIRDEICFYMLYNYKANLMQFNEAMDFQIMQKILPRIQGSSFILREVLKKLFKICIGNQNEIFSDSQLIEDMQNYLSANTVPYRRAAKKILFMLRRFEEDGFTSYWL